MFSFIKWWWDRRTGSEQFLTVMFTWIAASLLSIPLFGIHAIGILLGGMVFIVLCIFLYALYQALLLQIEEYKSQKAAEADSIVDRLAGRR